ncbi:MAG: hypothetical protein MRERC_11c048 [Mycoplasmataceae bacterium RC_NB112A]|nr:MAG: hypothetical protein MRERC_11c048 [Mycoplasmataceae bacterium RC_NB112A]
MRIKRNRWKSLLYYLITSNIVYSVVYLLYQYFGYQQIKFWHGLVVTNVIVFLFWLFRTIEWEI